MQNARIATDDDLFSASFQGGYDDDEPWAAINELRSRDTESIFHKAEEYRRSPVPLQRARALDVLAQLGGGKSRSERPHFEASITIAVDRLADPNLPVRSSAALALAHLGKDRSVSALIAMRDNPDPHVRHAVAYGIAGSVRSDAIATLLLLMSDVDDDVRDWATFSLGTQSNEDSPEIRGAFRKRLSDSFRDARQEAVRGLARRRDRQGLTLLLARLSSANGPRATKWPRPTRSTSEKALHRRISARDCRP